MPIAAPAWDVEATLAMPDRSDNPFAAPAAPLDVPPEHPTGAEAIRRAHLAREGVVRAAGVPFLLAGLVLASIALAGTFGIIRLGASLAALRPLGLVLLTGTASAGLFLLVSGLRGFRSWARPVALAVAAGALALLLGWVAPASGPLRPVVFFGALVLALPITLLLPRASGFLFSAEYQRVLRATPELRYQAPAPVVASFVALVVITAGWIWRLLS